MVTTGLKGSAGKPVGKSNVPFWLFVLALVSVLAAFSRAEGDGRLDLPFEGISFDLGHHDSRAPDADGYSAARPSNVTFALLRLDGGRFVALYGPRAVGAAPVLAGLLIGDGNERGRGFASDNLHEFSLESGALRVSTQEGRFTPARFVERDTALGDTTPASAGHFSGRLSDATGGGPATLHIDDAGRVLIDSSRCSAQGMAEPPAASAPTRPLQASFEAGCAHHGETLRGHAWQRDGTLYVVLPTAALDGGAVFVGTAAGPDRRGVFP